MNKTKENSTKEKVHTQKKERNVFDLCHIPTPCMNADCTDVFFGSHLLAHFLSNHLDNPDKQLTVIHNGECANLTLLPDKCKLNKNTCLGVVAYAGYKNREETLPAKSALCTENINLYNEYESLQYHMPIIIMLCRTTWAAYSAKTKSQTKNGTAVAAVAAAGDVEPPKDKTPPVEDHIYIIWCCSVDHTTKMYATMTIYDKNYTQSRSALRLVRPFHLPQNIHDFLPLDTNYLCVTATEIQACKLPNDNFVQLEIKIDEK